MAELKIVRMKFSSIHPASSPILEVVRMTVIRDLEGIRLPKRLACGIVLKTWGDFTAALPISRGDGQSSWVNTRCTLRSGIPLGS